MALIAFVTNILALVNGIILVLTFNTKLGPKLVSHESQWKLGIKDPGGILVLVLKSVSNYLLNKEVRIEETTSVLLLME